MKVEVRLFATLAKYRPQKSGWHEWIATCAEGTTIRELLLQTGVPLETAKLIFLNGVLSTPETVLQDGDRLGVFPPIGGG